MNSQGSSYLGLWREPAPGAVCTRSGRFPVFISRFAMRGNMGYELTDIPETGSVDPPFANQPVRGNDGKFAQLSSCYRPESGTKEQNSISKISPKSPSAAPCVESPEMASPALTAGEQNFHWLKELNEVTKFHERNIGHDHLFRVDSRNIGHDHLFGVEEGRDKLTSRRFGRMRDVSEDPFPRAMQAKVRTAPKTIKADPVIEAAWLSEDLDDSLVDFVVPVDQTEDQDATPVGGNVPRKISNDLATGPKHHQEERDVGGCGESSSDGTWNSKEDQKENGDDICREFRLKAKLDNQLDAYVARWDENGNRRC